MRSIRISALRCGAAALARGLAMAAVAVPAQADPRIEQACPPDADLPEGYADVPATGPFADAIDCAVWWGVLDGEGDYRPGVDSSRGHIASMLAPLVRLAGKAEWDVPSAGFTDTRGGELERDVDLLAAYDVVRGTSATTFEPDAKVTRGQFAAMAARMHLEVYGSQRSPAPHDFRDVTAGGPFAEDIAWLVGIGVTNGVTTTRFDPGGSVTRGQIAAFTMRYADVLVRQGWLSNPATADDGDGRADDTHPTAVGSGEMDDWCMDVPSNFYSSVMSFNYDVQRVPAANHSGCVWVHQQAPPYPGQVGPVPSPDDGVRVALRRAPRSEFQMPEIPRFSGDLVGGLPFHITGPDGDVEMAVLTADHTWFMYAVTPNDWSYQVEASDVYTWMVHTLEHLGYPTRLG